MGIVKARTLSRATMANIRQNLILAFGYNAITVPIAAGILYPGFSIFLSPIIASAAVNIIAVACAWLLPDPATWRPRTP